MMYLTKSITISVIILLSMSCTAKEDSINSEAAQLIESKFKDVGMRVKLDNRPDKISAKIRQAEINKVPVMLILGEKEAGNKTATVRRRFVKDQEVVELDSLIKRFTSEINKRSLPYRES